MEKSTKYRLINDMAYGAMMVRAGAAAHHSIFTEDTEQGEAVVGSWSIQRDGTALGWRCSFSFYDMAGEGSDALPMGAVMAALEDVELQEMTAYFESQGALGDGGEESMAVLLLVDDDGPRGAARAAADLLRAEQRIQRARAVLAAQGEE